MAVVKMVGLFPAVGFVGRLAVMTVPDMKYRFYMPLSPSLFQPLSPTPVPTVFPPLLGTPVGTLFPTPLGTLLGTPFSYFPMLRIKKLPQARRQKCPIFRTPLPSLIPPLFRHLFQT